MATAAVASLMGAAALRWRREGDGSRAETAGASELRRRAVMEAYLEAERALRRRGYPRRDIGTTPHRYAGLIAAPTTPALAGSRENAGALPDIGAFVTLSALATRAVYGPAEPTDSDLGEARRLRRAVEASLKRRAWTEKASIA